MALAPFDRPKSTQTPSFLKMSTNVDIGPSLSAPLNVDIDVGDMSTLDMSGANPVWAATDNRHDRASRARAPAAGSLRPRAEVGGSTVGAASRKARDKRQHVDFVMPRDDAPPPSFFLVAFIFGIATHPPTPTPKPPTNTKQG
jgi:hypothetical protein